MKCAICLGDFNSGSYIDPPEPCGCGEEAQLQEWRLWSRSMWIDLLFLRAANYLFCVGDKLWRMRRPQL